MNATDASLDPNTQQLIEMHSRLVRSMETAADETWSLAQPSPFRAVPTITTDSIILASEA